MTIPETARALIESDAVATLATIDADGRPNLTSAWIGLEEGEIVIGTLFDQRKLRNIRRDPRVSLSIHGTVVNEHGLREYLVVRGNARLTDGGAADLLQRLAFTYLGPEVRFPPMPDPPPGWVVRIAPERFGGVGPWTA